MKFVHEKNIEIDPELERLLPPLSKEDYEMLEQSLPVENREINYMVD